MKHKMYLKNNNQKNKIVFFITLFLSALIINIYFISHILINRLNNYSKIEIEKILNTIVNNLVKKNITNNLDSDKIINVYKNKDDDIVYADFNNNEVNSILSDAITIVEKELINIDNGKMSNLLLPLNIYSKYNKLNKAIVIDIPTGTLINNKLFYNIGPKIPVKVEMIGGVSGYINTKIDEYGINNSIVTVSMIIEVEEQIVLPITTTKVVISTDIPIATKLIQGKIPTYYQNGLNQNSPIFSLPKEDN